jgi:hypothetical protein
MDKSQRIKLLAADFKSYKGARQQVKYPAALWQRALKLCEEVELNELAAQLQVSPAALIRHQRAQVEEKFSFIPVQFETPPKTSTRICIESPFPIAIEFQGSSIELAAFVLALQNKGGL